MFQHGIDSHRGDRGHPTRPRLGASCAYYAVVAWGDRFVAGADDGQYKVPSDRELPRDLQRGGARPPQSQEGRQSQDQGAPRLGYLRRRVSALSTGGFSNLILLSSTWLGLGLVPATECWKSLCLHPIFAIRLLCYMSSGCVSSL